jgi:hypothetical protein
MFLFIINFDFLLKFSFLIVNAQFFIHKFMLILKIIEALKKCFDRFKFCNIVIHRLLFFTFGIFLLMILLGLLIFHIFFSYLVLFIFQYLIHLNFNPTNHTLFINFNFYLTIIFKILLNLNLEL